MADKDSMPAHVDPRVRVTWSAPAQFLVDIDERAA